MLIEWVLIGLMAYLIINEIWGIDLKSRLDDAFCRLGIAKNRCRVPVRVETDENEIRRYRGRR